MCEDIHADYAESFKNFFEEELNRSIKWITHGINSEDVFKDKYILLINVQGRIPENIQDTLTNFKIQGKEKMF